MNEIDEKEITPEQMKGVETFHLTAVVFGYNEMIREARTLGERVYCRLARDVYIERLRATGGKINVEEESSIILILGRDDAPSLALREKDVGLMRAAVAEWDAKQEKNGLVEDLKEVLAHVSPEMEMGRMLLRLEWGGSVHDEACCPCCEGFRPIQEAFPTSGEGHDSDCELAAVLKKAGLR